MTSEITRIIALVIVGIVATTLLASLYVKSSSTDRSAFPGMDDDPAASAVEEEATSEYGLGEEHKPQSSEKDLLVHSVDTREAARRIFSDVYPTQTDQQIVDSFVSQLPVSVYRIVSFDYDGFMDEMRHPGAPHTFELPLRSRSPIELVSAKTVEHFSGWKTGLGTWRGRVSGDETSRATFVTASDGTINGVIRSDELGRVKIEPIKGTQLHLIWQADPDIEVKID